MRTYKIWLHETEAGPYTHGDLLHLASVGTITPETPVREVNDSRWSTWQASQETSVAAPAPPIAPISPAVRLGVHRHATAYPTLRGTLDAIWIVAIVLPVVCWIGYGTTYSDGWLDTAIGATVGAPGLVLLSFLCRAFLDIADAHLSRSERVITMT